MYALRERDADAFYLDFSIFDTRTAEVFVSSKDDKLVATFDDGARGITVSTENVEALCARQSGLKRPAWREEPNRIFLADIDGVARYEREQNVGFCSNILALLEAQAFCLYPRVTSGHWGRKQRQLLLAAELGFRVPKTYVGNDLERMRDFARSTPRIISKPIIPQILHYDKDSFRTYTSVCTLEDLEAIASAKYPATLQEAFIEKTDIRVGVVGQRIMATAIHLDGRKEGDPIVDFRHFWEQDIFSNKQIVRPEAHELPKEVESRCLEFVRRCKLQYSMMDLLLLPDGEYVFLENNTHGMYGEVESGGHDVMGAVADLLIKPDELRLS